MEDGELADGGCRGRLADHLMGAKAHALTVRRAAEEAKGNQAVSAVSSIMKNSSTSLGQQKSELSIEALGWRGLGWEGDDFGEDELSTVRTWLSGKAWTIFGGSNEIQNNIISKRILGLPDATRST